MPAPTVAEDYFAAMQRVEQRLEIVPPKQEENIEDVKVQPELFQIIEWLEMPELCFEERLEIAIQLREVWKIKTSILSENDFYFEGFLEELAQ